MWHASSCDVFQKEYFFCLCFYLSRDAELGSFKVGWMSPMRRNSRIGYLSSFFFVWNL